MQKLHKPKDWRWLLHRALSIVFSRTVVTVVLVLAQAVWLFSVFYWLSDYSHLISRVGLAVSALMCLALVRKDSTAPEFKISWMILFMLMPVQGGLLYLMWGNKRPAIPLRRRMERAEAELAPLRTGDPAARAELARRDPRLAETADYLQNYAASPVFGGTAVRYYPVGDVMLPDMLADLQAAQHSIFVESFIIGMGEMWGQIHEILRQKAAAGLDVRVIYDDAGCLSLLPHNYVDLLRADGIRAFSFNRCVPVLNLVLNNRDHRKIMVVDGRIAYTGGVNLADEYINKVTRFGHWKDSGVRLEGPAARSYANVFLTFWRAHFPNETSDYDKLLPQIAPVAPYRRHAGAALCRQPRRPGSGSQKCVSGVHQPGPAQPAHLHALPDFGQRPAHLFKFGRQAWRGRAHLHPRRAGQKDHLPAVPQLLPASAQGGRKDLQLHAWLFCTLKRGLLMTARPR